jgi:hypothetical protein
MARATVASAAANIIMKMANMIPSMFRVPKRAKATKLRLAALKINSTPIRTATALRRVKTQKKPRQNNIAPTRR